MQKTPDDAVGGQELKSPAADFTTGFENATPESLQSFVGERVEGINEFPNFVGEMINAANKMERPSFITDIEAYPRVLRRMNVMKIN